MRQSEAADGEVVDGQEIVSGDEVDRVVADRRYPEVAAGIPKRTSGKVVVGDCPCAGSWSLRNLRLEYDLRVEIGCRRLASAQVSGYAGAERRPVLAQGIVSRSGT